MKEFLKETWDSFNFDGCYPEALGKYPHYILCTYIAIKLAEVF